MITMTASSTLQREIPERVHKAISKVLFVFMDRAEAIVKKATPRDTGTLVRSYQKEISSDRVSLFTNVDYAIVIEEGAVPHFPPVAAMLAYVRRKRSKVEWMKKMSIDRAAYLVGASLAGIHRRPGRGKPYPAHRMFAKGAKFLEREQKKIFGKIIFDITKIWDSEAI